MRDVTARLGQVVVNDMANKPIMPLDVDKVVRVASKCTVPPFGHKVIHGKVNLVLHGCRAERDDSRVGKKVAFPPFGDGCADCILHPCQWQQPSPGHTEEQYSRLA